MGKGKKSGKFFRVNMLWVIKWERDRIWVKRNRLKDFEGWSSKF
jgi:hypothetical protein